MMVLRGPFQLEIVYNSMIYFAVTKKAKYIQSLIRKKTPVQHIIISNDGKTLLVMSLNKITQEHSKTPSKSNAILQTTMYCSTDYLYFKIVQSINIKI